MYRAHVMHGCVDVLKQLPKVTFSYERLYQMLLAPIRTTLLLTAIELNVFTALSKPMSAEDVAKMLGTHPGNTRVFLDSLAAIDLLHKKGGQYSNEPIAQAFLVDTSPTFLGRLFTAMKPDDQVLQHLPQLVQEGPPPPPETPPFSEEAFAEAVVLMADVERAGYAQDAINILVALPEFPSFRRMLDLGGGPGLIGMTIVDAHPTMTGTIFDLPPVVTETKKYIQEWEMEDRVDVLSGDFTQDSIGGGYDLVWASAVLQFAPDIDAVVNKVYESLTPRGVFVSLYPFGYTHERTKPESIVLSLLSMAVRGQEVGVDHGYVADSMIRVGFRSVHSRTVCTAMGPMELDIARK